MKNIDLNIKRMLSLLESKMGNVKPLINEQVAPASLLPKQDWILAKESEDWLKWIITSGCITNIPGATGSKIGGITTTATENLPNTELNDPYIKVTNFKRINNIGKEIPTNLYILGKKSREGKEGYFKLFLRTQGDESPYLEGQLNCSVEYKDETTSVASKVRGINVEDPINKALFEICYTRQPDPNYAPQSETETTIKKICDDNSGVCGTNSQLKKYAEGQQGIIAIFEMSPDQKRKSACRTNEDIVNTRQSLWNLKRQNKKTLKSVRDKQSCKAMLETAKGCKNKEPGVCNQLINNNQDLRGLAYPAAKMEMVKFIKFCRDENMYNQNQLERVNDLQLEQTIGKNIRESLKELNLINKIG